MDSTIGYITPEFPGQTHIWVWREIVHMRQYGARVVLFSTRRPAPSIRARHGFADPAEAETTYLWPLSPGQILREVGWAVLHHPIGLLRCFGLALTLPVDARPRWRHTLPLIVPACRFAHETEERGIVHMHSHACANSAILCMMVKRLIGVPFSMSLNANIEIWGGAMKEKFEDAKFTNTHTQWLLDQMRRDFPSLRPEQSLLARTGVDPERWKPAPRASERPAVPFRVMSVSRLHWSKGHDDLIRAIARLIHEGRDVTLDIVGAGEEGEALKQLAAELKIADRVVFHGSLGEDAVIELLRGADAFALASHAETLGMVYIEAMSLEIPTIGTAAGGVGEIITSGENGLLVPPKDPQKLAEAIASLMDDPALRERLARSGRESIMQNFNSRVGAATLFERILDRPPQVLEALEMKSPS